MAFTGSSTYDVFLSFRGEDTRKTFISFLHKALKKEGINVFLDSTEIGTGERIGPTILAAIKGSKISIPVFSERYANSKWCLNELAQIVECLRCDDQFVLPIFFHVDPSDVRNQRNGCFARAFQKHENKKDLGPNIINGWRDALKEIGNLKGEVVDDSRDQAEVVDLVVTRVSNHLAVRKQHIRINPPAMEKPSSSDVWNQRKGDFAKAFQQHENEKDLKPYILKGWRNALPEVGNFKGEVVDDTREQADDLVVTRVGKKCIRTEKQYSSDSDSDNVEPDHPMRRRRSIRMHSHWSTRRHSRWSTQRDSRRSPEARFSRFDSRRPSDSGWSARREAPSLSLFRRPLVEEEDDDSYSSDGNYSSDDDDVHVTLKKITIYRN